MKRRLSSRDQAAPGFAEVTGSPAVPARQSLRVYRTGRVQSELWHRGPQTASSDARPGPCPRVAGRADPRQAHPAHARPMPSDTISARRRLAVYGRTRWVIVGEEGQR